jgi:hypothetical protein
MFLTKLMAHVPSLALGSFAPNSTLRTFEEWGIDLMWPFHHLKNQ